VLALVLIALTSKFPAKVTYARVVPDFPQIAFSKKKGENPGQAKTKRRPPFK
jgi:hypothetical protein